MARAKDFERELAKLIKRRTHWLRGVLVKPRPGAAPTLSKAHVDRAIRRMQSIASDALAPKLARREFEAAVDFRKSWHPKLGKGWGRSAKRRRFREWFEKKVRPGPTIYVFWARRRCLYVGKTSGSGGRVSSHFDKHWFGAATRVDIYALSQSRSLSALECLAIHRFQPSYNRARAESRKWTLKCPLCKVHKNIRAELRDLFRLR